MRPEKKMDRLELQNLHPNGRLTESEEAPGYQEENVIMEAGATPAKTANTRRDGQESRR